MRVYIGSCDADVQALDLCVGHVCVCVYVFVCVCVCVRARVCVCIAGPVCRT